MDVVINDLTNSREFVEGIVDKIVNETNLSEVIMKIEPLVKENQELRSLIYSQQQMMNEMNTMLLRLLNNTTEPVSVTSVTEDNVESEIHDEGTQDDGMINNDGLYEITNIVLMEASVVDVESATIVEDNVEKTAEASEATVATAEADAQDIIESAEQDDDYDTTPHFPEHISLLIREIPSDSA
jgi:hypothetical protein